MTANQLQLAGDVDERHGHHSPEIALPQIAGCRRNVFSNAPPVCGEFEICGNNVLKLASEGIRRIGVLVDIVAGEHGFLHAEGFRKIVSNDAQREEASVEFAEFAIHSSRGEHAEAVIPGSGFSGETDTRNVFLRKPHVVREIAAVYCEKFLG